MRLVAGVFILAAFFWPGVAHAASQPELVISAYTTKPADLSPGQTFDLSLTLTNKGDRKAKRVKVTLLEGATPGALPVTVQGSGNVRFVGDVGADGAVGVAFRLMTLPDLKTGAYTLRFRIDGVGATAFTSTQFVGIKVARVPRLEVVTFTAPKSVREGREFKISAEVGNLSDFPLQGVALEISSPALELTDNSLYVGALDAGDSDVIEAGAKGRKAGPATVRLIVRYQDDQGNRKYLEQSAEVVIKSKPEPKRGERGFWGSVGNFLRSLFGLGESTSSTPAAGGS